jgi:DNA polymerase-1
MSRTLLLIDLSSIAVPIYKMSGNEADPNYTATQTVARVRSLAQGADATVVCCDSGRSFRHEVSESYKANRPPSEAPLHHQIGLACETLKAEGFPVWSVKGFEADDIISTAVHRALEDADDAEDTFVSIASADKDLLQLVGWHVTAKSLRDGSVIDDAAVFAKFGVKPEQMRDYLTLVGDASDNIKGAKGVGPKTAAAILAKFGTLDALYADLRPGADALTARALGLTPAVADALLEFAPFLDETRQLITLRTDVPLPFEDAWRPRVVAPAESSPMFAEPETSAPAMSEPAEVVTATVVDESPAPSPAPAPPAPAPKPMADVTPMPAPAQSSALSVVAPVEFSKQLEPRTLNEAGQLAKWVHESRQFSAYGTPQAVLATVLAGRELGLQAMASLRSIHIIEGKPTLSADLIRALVMQSPTCEYFRCTERTETRATFETKRRGDPPIALSFTIEEGRAAWKKDDAAWKKSGWGTFPADMLVARASAKLARLVYPEVCFGLYTPDELTDGRAA